MRKLSSVSQTLLKIMPAAVVLVSCGGGDNGLVGRPTSEVSPAITCASLVGTPIPASNFSLATAGAVVLSALDTTDTDSANVARSYCKVTGSIKAVDSTASPILFQANLPKVWNRRFLQFGGGGTNGSVVTGLTSFSNAPADIPTPLAKGYVTLGSDSGHSSAGKPPFDTSFALNQEELMNFGQWQIKKTLDAVKVISRGYYGSDPSYVYFAGGSQGGHESFDAAQRYPNDYDGVIAHYPAFNVINMWIGAQSQAQAIYGKSLGVPSAAWSNPNKIASLVAHVVAQCDELDGIKDGIISDVRSCNAKVTNATIKTNLRCVGGTDSGDSCFSDAQLAAIEKIASPVQYSFAFAGGSTTYPRWPLLEGGTFLQNHLGKTNTADLNKVPFVADGTAFQLFPAKGGIQGFITKNLNQDPLAFDATQWVPRIQEVSALTDAVSLNLTPFSSKGGKVLLTHGTIDDSISPHNTIAYWEKLVAANGQSDLDKFMRFYLIPGMGHGSGVFSARHDYLSTLEAWVERNSAPGQLVTSDGNTASATVTLNGRTRPLCLYGSWPKYTGQPSPTQAQANDAANYTCTKY
jgi:pimeloyl-ACP methyl ester carboxylesterase